MEQQYRGHAHYSPIPLTNPPLDQRPYEDYSTASYSSQGPHHAPEVQYSNLNHTPQPYSQPLVSPVQPSLGPYREKGPQTFESPAYISRGQYGRSRTSRSLLTLINEWRWELFCWLFGTVALTAIITLLVVFHDALLSKWSSKVRTTAIIAGLAQASTSSLLVPISSGIAQLKWTWFHQTRATFDLDSFDRASRGPEGSFLLIFRLGRPKLVTIGALAIILLFAFPTFIQQSVKVDLRNVIRLSKDAVIDRAMFYSKTSTGSLSFSSELYGQLPDIHMANTLNAAMLDSYRSLSNVTGNCPNDRCTWEPYTSLGICYTTEDITSTITDYKGNLTVSQRQPVIEASVFGDKNTNTSPYWTFGSTALYFTDGAELTQESIPTPNNTDSNFPDIADIYVLYYDPCHDGTTDYRESKNWRAFKATTRLCLQTLQSSFNASMNTTMLSSRSDLTWVLSASADTLDEQYCVEEKGEIFCIDRPTLRVLGGQMSINFNTTGSLIPGGDDYYGARWSPNLVQDILGAPATKCNNATAGLGYEGFSNRIRNIAVAMTNEMRTSNATDFVTGTTTASEQYIAVEYIWISYPIAVYAILTIFFFSTIFATRRDPLWKSSPLALLHAMDGNKTNSSMKQMEEEAKQTRVRFAYPGMGLGWQLVPESPQATQVRLSRRGQVPES